MANIKRVLDNGHELEKDLRGAIMDECCKFCKSFSPTATGGWCLKKKRAVKRSYYCSDFKPSPEYLEDNGSYSQAAKYLDF